MRKIILLCSVLFLWTCGSGSSGPTMPEFEDPIRVGYIRATFSLSDNFGLFNINRYEFRAKQDGEYVGQTQAGNLSLQNSYDGKQDFTHVIVVPSDMTSNYSQDYSFSLKLYRDDYLIYDIETVHPVIVQADLISDVYVDPPLNFDWLILTPILDADIYNNFSFDFLPFINGNATYMLSIDDGKLIAPPIQDNYYYWWYTDLEKTQGGDVYVSFDLSRDLMGTNDGQFGVFFSYENNNMSEFFMIDFEKNKVLSNTYDHRNGGSWQWNNFDESYSSFNTQGVMKVDMHYDYTYGNNYDKYGIFINGQSIAGRYKADQNITRIGIVKSGTHKSIIDNFMVYH